MQEAKDAECYADFDEAIKIDADNANIYHHRGQVKLYIYVLFVIVV